MTRRTMLGIVAAAVALGVLVAVSFFFLQPSPQAPEAPGAARTATPTATRTPTPTPTPPATTPAPPAAPEPPPPAPVCADDVLTCVNIARAENGLGALVASATLDGAAQACAERMAASGQLTHSTDHPGGYSAWGENIAVGYPSGLDVFNGWMASDGHRANILNPAYTEMGIGYVGAGSWWCQQFGG